MKETVRKFLSKHTIFISNSQVSDFQVLVQPPIGSAAPDLHWLKSNYIIYSFWNNDNAFDPTEGHLHYSSKDTILFHSPTEPSSFSS